VRLIRSYLTSYVEYDRFDELTTMRIILNCRDILCIYMYEYVRTKHMIRDECECKANDMTYKGLDDNGFCEIHWSLYAITYEMLGHRVLLNEAQSSVVETGSESEEIDFKSAKWSLWAAVSAVCWVVNNHAPEQVSICSAGRQAYAAWRLIAQTHVRCIYIAG